ncbi:MAG: penicillin-binding transpeptidase domain-containing protein, partial [Eubacteriales bacterium]
MESLLCHILGRIGPIFADEAQEYISEKGYSYNALIGKDGIEKVYEDDLRGIDGVAKYELDAANDVVGYEVVKQPKEGYSVRLTIDAALQKIVEDSLAEQIDLAVQYSALEGTDYAGEDCKAGAAVVVDVNTGEIRALVSSPGFDLNTFSQQFASIRDNPVSPLLNRATQGIYPPGSTFKMLTAAAALDTGTIDLNTYIYDKGEYDKYAPTYTPRCWIYLRYGTTHGYVNVVDALKVSCNYFFYTVADMLGIDTIVQYAQDFGLGVKTGIEVPESEGILASPAFREANGYVWNPGDTLQMAIGQSDNAFTPLQLAMYMSTIVNGGNRYQATLLKSIDEYYTGKPVRENEPVLLSRTHLSDSTVGIIKAAMRSVVDDEGGTAQSVFAKKPYARDIGGKTGTAQVSHGSDTVLFVGFAPYDNPEIAVAVVVENGYRSARAASVAADIFDYYFQIDQTNGDAQ